MQLRLIIGLIVAVLLVIFALQNADPISITLWFWEMQSSLAIVLMIMLLMGAALSAFLSIPGYMKNKELLKQQKKRIAELEQQLEETTTTNTPEQPNEDTTDPEEHPFV